MIPRNPCNPSRKLWIDSQYHIVLASEIYDPDGKLRAQTTVEHVEFGRKVDDHVFEVSQDLPASVAFPSMSPACKLSYEQLAQEVGYRPAKPRYVPQGYTLDGYYRYDCACCAEPHVAAVTRFVDGLCSISIFELHGSDVQCFFGAHKQHDDSEILQWDVGWANVVNRSLRDVHFSVIGEIARRELVRIARSLQLER